VFPFLLQKEEKRAGGQQQQQQQRERERERKRKKIEKRDDSLYLHFKI
jgi:hypothetical protein